MTFRLPGFPSLTAEYPPTIGDLTLWRVLTLWWQWRTARSGDWLGQWMIVPAGAKILERRESETHGVRDPLSDATHTIGWKMRKP